MKDYTHKLKKLTKQPRWKILAFTVIINTLLALKHIADFYQYLNANFPNLTRRFVPRTPTRTNFHIISRPRRHPDRLAFLTLSCLVLVGMIQLSSPTHIIYWAIGWGSAFAAFTLYLTIRIIKKSLAQNQQRIRISK